MKNKIGIAGLDSAPFYTKQLYLYDDGYEEYTPIIPTFPLLILMFLNLTLSIFLIIKYIN
jgi:hypothetical protein